MEVSEEALAKARGFLGDRKEEPMVPGIVAFSTARGKPVEVSEEAMAKARGVMGQREEEHKDLTRLMTQRGRRINHHQLLSMIDHYESSLIIIDHY